MEFMMMRLVSIIMMCVCLGMEAQTLKLQGSTVQDIVPDGWQHVEAQGDLNKDGIIDLVVVVTPDFEENCKSREDGYVYNFNQPILAIYFGTNQGEMHLWKKYDNVIPADESEFCRHETGLEITTRGTLLISNQLSCSAGSYGTSENTYTYRYQGGDFYLIGFDQEELQRNTGEYNVISENYLTWKRQVKKSNMFDESVPVTEKWSKLSKKPLEKLGDIWCE